MPNPPTYSEGGNQLPLISLGGVQSQTHQGRIIASNSLTISGPVILALGNPRRIALIVQNIDDPAHLGSYVEVYLGGLNSIPIFLAPYGTLQIDRDFPWIGEVWVAAALNNPVVTYNEIDL